MANIEYFTGFEGCGKEADLLSLIRSRDSISTTYSATGGYANGKCARSNSNYSFSVGCAAGKTKCVGFHLAGLGTSSSISSGYPVMVFEGPDIRIANHAAGVTAYRGTTAIGSCNTVITSGLSHIEIKLYSHSSAGTVQVKLNGTTILDLTNVNTGGQDITGCFFGGYAPSIYRYTDNIFIADDFVGELLSVLLKPIADGSVEFSRSAGSNNYENVDDSAQDGDSTYNYSGTNGQKDLFDYSDLSNVYRPQVLSLVTVARKDGTDTVKLQAISKQDSTEYNIGGEISLLTTYPSAVGTGIYKTLSLCPDGTALTAEKVNALQFGYKAIV